MNCHISRSALAIEFMCAGNSERSPLIGGGPQIRMLAGGFAFLDQHQVNLVPCGLLAATIDRPEAVPNIIAANCMGHDYEVADRIHHGCASLIERRHGHA